MCKGELELLKVIYMVSLEFVSKPYAWGMLERESLDTYFLLIEFRDIDKQVC